MPPTATPEIPRRLAERAHAAPHPAGRQQAETAKTGASGLTRRALLLALPAAAALGACRTIWSDDELAERLVAAAVWGKRRHWTALGKAYLEANPAAGDRHALIGQLARRIGWRHLIRPAELRERIRDRVREDFRSGRTTLLAGWLLSETEAWLAALVALERKRG